MTPSARSTKYLRALGFIVARVEQRLPIPGKFVTRDAFNFGDLLVAKPNYGVALVQVTSRSNMNARERKAREIPELKVWLDSGGKFLLHGWGKKGPRGKRKKWAMREIQFEVDSDGFGYKVTEITF
jgi:hypothetical protein